MRLAYIVLYTKFSFKKKKQKKLLYYFENIYFLSLMKILK